MLLTSRALPYSLSLGWILLGSILSLLPTESVCMGRPGIDPPSFYMYSCLFSDLHVSLPFDKFTMGVLRALNVAPTQIHPNT